MAISARGEGAGGRSGELIDGKYQLGRRIGAGGMGEVYEARHAVIGRRFAVKLLLPEYARKRDMLARFQREAQAAGALESEHIAAVTDLGVTGDGAPYLLMEFLDGEDLRRALARSGPFDVARAVDLVIQACRGLAVAHGSGIVHRDVKPENLFLLPRSDGGELLKILDFGIAKLRDSAGARSPAPADVGAGAGHVGATRSGVALGTPSYMSPEQARGDREIDQRSDIYALGVILYELLCGRRPHDGDSYNAILFRILNGVPEPLARLREGLPAGLAEVVACAMAFDARDRYPGARDLAVALAPFASPARARTAVTPPRRAPSAPAATMPAPDSAEHPAAGRPRASAAARGPARSRRVRTAAVAVAVTAAAAAVAAVALFSPSRAAGDRRRAPAAAPAEASRSRPPSLSKLPASASAPPSAVAVAPSAAGPPAVAPPSAFARRPPAAPQSAMALARPRRSAPAAHAASPTAAATAAPAPGPTARNRSTVPSSAAALEFDSRNPYDD